MLPKRLSEEMASFLIVDILKLSLLEGTDLKKVDFGLIIRIEPKRWQQ